MWRVGNIILLILTLTATTVGAATFEFFKDPLPSTWASFAFDADGDKLACNYGGHLFLWSPESGFKDLGDGHPQSGSIGISADGTTICATRVRPADGYLNPALWSMENGWVDLGHTLDGFVENGSWGSGFDLSDDGTEVVGLAWTNQGGQAFHWAKGQGMNRLAPNETGSTSRATAIAGNGSLIIGFLEHPQHGCRLPVLWFADDPNTPLHYAGPEVRGEALAVNSQGTMVVGYHVSNQVEQAHYWTPVDGMVPLGNLSRSSWDPSRATHVTDNGTVLGTSTQTTWNVTEVFFWDPFDGMVRLQDLLVEQGAIIPDDLWINQVLAVSGDATKLLGSWRNAQNEQGYWMAQADTRQKGRIRECLASLDGSRLDLDFELALADTALRPILIADRDGHRWDVPLTFKNLTCRGTDHEANLGRAGEVVYELTLESEGKTEVLERFSIWTENPSTVKNSLLGSLSLQTQNNQALNIRIQGNDHLVISSTDESGRLIVPLSNRVFEAGYHRIPWKAPVYRGAGKVPGQYIHIQWQ